VSILREWLRKCHRDVVRKDIWGSMNVVVSRSFSIGLGRLFLSEVALPFLFSCFLDGYTVCTQVCQVDQVFGEARGNCQGLRVRYSNMHKWEVSEPLVGICPGTSLRW
jgi:hypothetical protein